MIVGSLSKTYAMTGWRLGYALAPAADHSAMQKLQSQSTSNPTSIVQKAAVAALNGPQDCVEEMRAGIHSTAGSHRDRTARHSRDQVHHAGGRVLCVSEYFVVLRSRRNEVGSRCRRPAVA